MEATVPKYDYVIPEHDVRHNVWLAITSLHIDAQAQRSRNEHRCQSIADNWLPSAMGEIQVSKRDGTFYVIDGQHRVRAAELVGEERVRCIVHEGLTRAEEAQLFLVLNQESTRPSAADEFHIGVAAGIDLFVDAQKVVEAHGLRVGSGTSPNIIGAAAQIRDIVKTWGPDVLDKTLTLSAESFGRETVAWDAAILGGLATFVGKHGNDPTVRLELLATKLARRGAIRILGEAVPPLGGSTGTNTRKALVYRVVVRIWNTRRPRDEQIRVD